MHSPIKDKLKQDINIGDYVVYRLTGRSGSIQYGKVTRITLKEDDLGQLVLDGQGNPIPTIYVRAMIDYNTPRIPVEVAKRDSRLTQPDRMVVFNGMPQWVKNLYTQAGL
jgi:hypothetical protein